MNGHFSPSILMCVLVTVLGLPCLLPAAVLRVDPNQEGAFSTLQGAIDASAPGDTILVATGLYRGEGNRALSFEDKAITLRSEGGPERCVIDCEGVASAFALASGCPGLTLDGFTITNGRGAPSGGAIQAVGVGRLTVLNCTFRGNEAIDGDGGAVLASECHAEFRHCAFESNGALDKHGGAVFVSGYVVLDDCRFVNNSGRHGGALAAEFCHATFCRCTFESNTARGNGGAIDLDDGHDALLEDCRFANNSAQSGGGALYDNDSDLTFRRCGFFGNQALYGGAVYNGRGSRSSMTNCVLSGNVAEYEGGGARLWGDGATLLHCTVHANTSRYGGGLSFDPDKQDRARMYGTIVWGNQDETGQTDFAQIAGTDPDTLYCCIQDWPAADTVIADDPLFADALGLDGQAGTMDDDLALRAGSPCIDAGFLDTASWPFDRDYSGRDRLLGSVVDIGAHEFGAGESNEGSLLPCESIPVVISEVLAHSPGGRDWVELHNTTGQPINVSGWQIRDQSENSYAFPRDTWIDAHGYQVFYQGNDFPFGFEAKGDTITLVSAVSGIETGCVQSHALWAVRAGTTLVRHVNSVGLVEMVPSTEATLGAANAPFAVGPLVITEIMYHPSEEQEGGPYVEICNMGLSAVDGYWRLSGMLSCHHDFSLPPGGRAVVAADPNTLLQTYPDGLAGKEVVEGTFHGNITYVTLSVYDQENKRYVVREKVTYNSGGPFMPQAAWRFLWPETANGQGDALHRMRLDDYANDPNNWEAAPPTPGE